MHSVGQFVSVPIASASPFTLTFATQSDMAWWAAAAFSTGLHRFALALHGRPVNQVAISTRKLSGRLGHIWARIVVSCWIVGTYGLDFLQVDFCHLGYCAQTSAGAAWLEARILASYLGWQRESNLVVLVTPSRTLLALILSLLC